MYLRHAPCGSKTLATARSASEANHLPSNSCWPTRIRSMQEIMVDMHQASADHTDLNADFVWSGVTLFPHINDTITCMLLVPSTCCNIFHHQKCQVTFTYVYLVLHFPCSASSIFLPGVLSPGMSIQVDYCPMSAKQHAPIHLLHHQKELGRTSRSLPSVLLSWVGRDNPSKTFGILSEINCLWKQPPCISLQTYCSGWPLTITNRCTGVWPSIISKSSKIWLHHVAEAVSIERCWPCLWWVFPPSCAVEYGHVQFIVKFGMH